MGPFESLTRRQVVAGAGSAAAITAFAGAAPAQNAGFQTIRARETGYEDTFPGPLLRVRRGEEVRVRLINELSVPTAIHWHGVRVPNAMDGTALTQRFVAPGASFDYRFTPPDAGTFWYRPATRTAGTRALAGLLIVQEATPPRIDDEVPLLIASSDSKFTANGLRSHDISVWPKHRVRLRLANATEQFVTLRIPGHPMHVVAIDGQPSEPFLSRESRITLSPGNRADVLVDCVMKPSSTEAILARDGGDETPLARLVYGSAIVPPGATMADGYSGEPVRPLEPNPLPERMDFRNAVRVSHSVDAGLRDLTAKALFSVKRGRTVMLALSNKSDSPAVMHIHGHSVRLLDALDDGWKPFWLDTILCAPGQITRVAFVADNPGKWLLDARTVGSDVSLLAWFDVTS